ncbi:hypothetical protein MYX77_02795 [Acidobacteriia bacterium AH_259_A11_L15]|nr:hypothetical protein [Acidobacteriia bacterium AH_259_A11_L15]
MASAAWTQTPVPERRVFAVSVFDSSGKPLEGLRAADFRGEYRGQQVKILSVEPNAEPRRIALLLDTSRSMEPGWFVAGAVAEDLVRSLSPDHEIAFYVLRPTNRSQPKENLNIHKDFTRDFRNLLLVLHEVTSDEPGDPTAVYDGIIALAHRMAPARLGDAIYLISDGVDVRSRSSARDLEIALASLGLRVFSVKVPGHPVHHPPGASMRFGRALRRLAKATGGMAVKAHSSLGETMEVTEEFRMLYDAITHVYRLEVELPRRVDKPRKWELKVVDANGKELKDVQVLYPRLLLPLSED